MVLDDETTVYRKEEKPRQCGIAFALFCFASLCFAWPMKN